MIGIMDVVDRASRPVRSNSLDFGECKMVLPVLITQFELTAHTGFLKVSFTFIEFFEVVEIAGTSLISTFKDGMGISRFPAVQCFSAVGTPVFSFAFFTNAV